jgi:hypothetical protein
MRWHDINREQLDSSLAKEEKLQQAVEEEELKNK